MLGGYDSNTNRLNEVEIVNLNGLDGSCSATIDAFPIDIDDSTLVYVDGIVSACSGYSCSSGCQSEQRCYDYSVDQDSWTRGNDLSEPKGFPSSCVMNNEWFIAGGTDYSGSVNTDVRINGVSTPGPQLPNDLYYGCQLAVNLTHVFFADGHDKITYILDWDQQEFTSKVNLHYICTLGLRINSKVAAMSNYM